MNDKYPTQIATKTPPGPLTDADVINIIAADFTTGIPEEITQAQICSAIAVMARMLIPVASPNPSTQPRTEIMGYPVCADHAANALDNFLGFTVTVHANPNSKTKCGVPHESCPLTAAFIIREVPR